MPHACSSVLHNSCHIPMCPDVVISQWKECWLQVSVLKTIALPHTWPNTEMGLCLLTDVSDVSLFPKFSILTHVTLCLPLFNQFLIHFSSLYIDPWHCFLALTFSLPLPPHSGNSLHCFDTPLSLPAPVSTFAQTVSMIQPHQLLPGPRSESSKKC